VTAASRRPGIEEVLLTEILAGVLGALLAASAIFLAEAWKQVLSGKAAARIIYVEAHSNGLVCEEATRGNPMGPLSDQAWKVHAVAVVPLLTIEAARDIATTYMGVPVSQAVISRGPESLETGSAYSLIAHSLDFRKAAIWMHSIENKGRLRALAEMLSGSVSLPSPQVLDQALEAQDREQRTREHETPLQTQRYKRRESNR
jgi:hypothetical protein